MEGFRFYVAARDAFMELGLIRVLLFPFWLNRSSGRTHRLAIRSSAVEWNRFATLGEDGGLCRAGN